MYYVYILFCHNSDKLYAGFSSDLRSRIKAHYNKQVYTTKRLGNPELIFYEAYLSKKDALSREKYFKTTKGKKALRLMLKESLKSLLCPIVP